MHALLRREWEIRDHRLSSQLMYEQLHGEINSWVQRICLNLCPIWCFIFKGVRTVGKMLS